MDDTEPLILEYDLQDWMNPVYTGGDRVKLCDFIRKDEYRGLLRVRHAADIDPTDEP